METHLIFKDSVGHLFIGASIFPALVPNQATQAAVLQVRTVTSPLRNAQTNDGLKPILFAPPERVPSRACDQPVSCQLNSADPDDLKWLPYYRVWAAEAANEFQVHPGLLLAIAHVESTMDPLRGRLEDFPGFCAVEPQTRAQNRLEGLPIYLNCRTAKTRDVRKMSIQEFCQVNQCGKSYSQLKKSARGGVPEFSVWSPRGQLIWAAARIQSTRALPLWVDQQIESKERSKLKRFKVRRNFYEDFLPKPDQYSTHRVRWEAARYNTGFGIQAALQAFYDAPDSKGLFPGDFGSAWEAASRNLPAVNICTGMKDSGQKTYKALSYESQWEITRCYVWQVAGLCGDEPAPASYFDIYARNFTAIRDGNKIRWAVKSGSGP